MDVGTGQAEFMSPSNCPDPWGLDRLLPSSPLCCRWRDEGTDRLPLGSFFRAKGGCYSNRERDECHGLRALGPPWGSAGPPPASLLFSSFLLLRLFPSPSLALPPPFSSPLPHALPPGLRPQWPPSFPSSLWFSEWGLEDRGGRPLLGGSWPGQALSRTVCSLQPASPSTFGLPGAGRSLRRRKPGKGLLDRGLAVRAERCGERGRRHGGEAIVTFASALFMT